MNSQQMREERAKLVIEARKIVDNADHESRNLTGEENAKWEKLMGEVDTLAEKISTNEKREATSKAEAELSKSYRKTSPTAFNTRKEGNREQAMRSWFLRGAGQGATGDQIENAAACGIDLSSQLLNVPLRSDRNENRALANGTLNIPDFGQGFDRALKAFGGAKNLVRTLQTSNGVSFNVPTADDTANSAVVVAEAGSIATNVDPTFSSVSLGAYKYSTRAILVSLELLQDSILPLESLLADMLAERLGRAINNHITVGTGSGQPYGLVTRAGNSSVVVGGTVASPTFSVDNLLDLIASVDPAYRANAKFMMNDATAFRYRKLKDSTGQYLWQPAVIAGQPDRLCGYEVVINQDMPSLAVNSKLTLFGDYGRYMWRECMDVSFYRLSELYSLTGQVGFHAIYRADGNLLNTSAVKYMSSPAS